jgi:two-component system copper resistance phosphate regulon response regulator CusR
MRTLLAVADATLGATLARGLLDEGIDVAVETSLVPARDSALHQAFDALIIDIALPGGGVELCRELWRRRIEIPIVLLTDADSMAERIRARDANAAACIGKPVKIRELVAQLRTPRRPGIEARSSSSSDRIVVEDLDVDVRSRAVHRAGRRIRLTPKEFALLEILVRHAGRVVDRPTIIAHVWGGTSPVESNMLEVLVRRLRRKIDDPYEWKLIRTVRAAGYLLGPRPLGGPERH